MLKANFKILMIPFLLLMVLHQPRLVSSLKVNVIKEIVYTNLGQNVDLFCSTSPLPVLITDTDSTPNPVYLCRWTLIPFDDEERTISLNITGTSIGGQVGPGKFSYFGQGVHQGECGLRIHEITHDQIGRWGCTLIGDDGPGTARVNVIQYVKPKKLSIFTEEYDTEVNVTDFGHGSDNITVVCCTLGGKPIEETKLALHLGDELLPVTLSQGADWNWTESESKSGLCVQSKTQFTYKDNGKVLICIVTHPAFSNGDGDEESETEISTVVHVNSPAYIIPYGDVTKNEFIENTKYWDDKVDLVFKVLGNPEPTVSVAWSESEETAKKEIKFVKVLATNVLIENNIHIFTVTIEAPKNTSKYVITVENSFGKDVGVTIVSPQPSSTGWTLIIVGIVMSVIFLLVIAFILNCTAKRRGWWCHKGVSS